MQHRPRSRRATVVAMLALVAMLPSAARAAMPAPRSQDAEDEVLAAVQALFDAMAAKDGAAIAALVMPEGHLVAMRGETAVGTPGMTTLGDFATSVAASEGALLERVWDPEVRIDGGLAMVWAPYDFHRDLVFSHCGIDQFTLVHTEQGWKIAGASYTVRREGCEPSPLGPPR